ncbi:MAG: hypothetical protein WA269_15715 [Candidatus Udaeobacter sp.]
MNSACSAQGQQLLLRQNPKSGFLKIAIVGERVGDPTLAHDDKGNAIAILPRLHERPVHPECFRDLRV